VAAGSKAWACGRLLAGIVSSNPSRGHGCLSVVSVVCRQVEVSAWLSSLVQRRPTQCDVSPEAEAGSKRHRRTDGLL